MPLIDTFCNLLGANFTPELSEGDVTAPGTIKGVPHPIFGYNWQLTAASSSSGGDQQFYYTDQGKYTKEELLAYPFVWEGKLMSPPPGVVELAMSQEIGIEYSYTTDQGSFTDNFTIPVRGGYQRVFSNEVEHPVYDDEGLEIDNEPAPGLPHRWMKSGSKTLVDLETNTLELVPHLSRSLLSKPNPHAFLAPATEDETSNDGGEGGLYQIRDTTYWSHSSATFDDSTEPEEIPTGVFYPEGLEPETAEEEEGEPVELKLLFFPGESTGFAAEAYTIPSRPIFVQGMDIWIVPTLFIFRSRGSFSGTFGYFDRSIWSADDLEKIDKVISDKLGEEETENGFYGVGFGGPIPPEPSDTLPDPEESAVPDSDVDITITPGPTFRPDFLTFETD